MRAALAFAGLAAILAACRAPPPEPPLPPPAAVKSASELARRLRGDGHFLVGLGNDLMAADHDYDGAFLLGTTLDLHYVYAAGLPGRGGWCDYDANGSFIDRITSTSDAHGTTPMFTLYAMDAENEDDSSVLTDDEYMGAYWKGARLLFQRLGAFGKPSVIHLEPDFWGFAQRFSPDGTGEVRVKRFAPECADLGDDLKGMAGCLLRLARQYAPRAAVGFHASPWAGAPQSVARFLRTIGADQADLVVTEMLDRDAGCWERATEVACEGPRLTGFYLDESNETSPNFHEVLGWAKAVHDGLGLPLLWWQLPLGVPSDKPGGLARHYRDNRVHYLFHHVDEFIAAGSVGAVFGSKAFHQTSIFTDGGQFRDAVANYFANPAELP